MQYISFYKERLPFKPKTNVVIYFDVTGISRKLYYDALYQHYKYIESKFHSGGLEFCFLPKIACDMDLAKIYHYFNPQAGPNDHVPYIPYDDRDLLEYVVADYDRERMEPGLIQYMGEDFDEEDTYTYAYTPIPKSFDDHPDEFIARYVSEHGVARNLFDVHGTADVFFEEAGVPKNCEVQCEQAAFERPSFWRSVTRFMRNDSAEQSRRETSAPIEMPDEPSVEDMMSEVQILVERLRQSGVGEVALQRLFKPTKQLSRMTVRYGRIFLTDYNNMEIRMHPLSKALYLLFLRHPEGISFSDLPDYRKELLRMYELMSGRDSREDIRRSIDDVTDPTRNSINEKCSRIKQAFLREFEDSIARNYYITGGRGEPKKILLPREMVTWE
ncbi:MAG: hypothetical protein IJR02_00980 [Bacteroidaceae bacterium]|nr:hypothetical protein [Bacteroidaceae bacterium]